MTGARAQVTIIKPADEVWGRIGDFGDLSWIPNVRSLQVDGDIRIFQLGHSTVKHRLVRHDDAARTYTYSLASEVAPHSGDVGRRPPEATLSVASDGPAASTVTWISETEERTGSAEGLRAFFQAILDHVKSQLEHP